MKRIKGGKGFIDPGTLFAILAIALAWGTGTIAAIDHQKAKGESVSISRDPLRDVGVATVVTYDSVRGRHQVWAWGIPRGRKMSEWLYVEEDADNMTAKRKAAAILLRMKNGE